MKAPQPPLRLITESSFKGSIKSDQTSSLWFLRSILNEKAILAGSPVKIRKNLTGHLFLQKVLFFLFVPLLMSVFLMTGNPLFVWLSLVNVAVLYFSDFRMSRTVAEIAWQWVNREFSSQELETMTYFQLTERLGNKYGVPSLVDTIALWDWKARKWILAVYFISSMVLFSNAIQLILMIMIALLLIPLFLRHRPVL